MKKERKPWSRRKKIWMSVLFVFLAFVASVGLQFGYNMLFVTPVGDSDLASDATDGLEQMLHDSLTLSDAYFADSAAVSSALSGTIQELNYRNDCSDFDANALLRIYLENQNRLDEKNKNEIRTCLLKFKYWPSEGDGRDDGMPWIIFPDVADIGRLGLGERITGSFSGTMTFTRKVSSAIAASVIGWVLALTGYIAPTSAAPSPTQPPNTILGIRLIICLSFAVLMGVAFIVSLGFKLDGSLSKQVKAINEKEEKGEALTEEETKEKEAILVSMVGGKHDKP